MRHTLEELAVIPAPGGQEEKRAEYCRRWLTEHGVTDVHMDDCRNVTAAYGIKPGKNNILLMAHLDTVFAEDTRLAVQKREGRLYCPGIGDDTANVVVLMFLMEKIWRERPEFSCGVLFALDVCEEGLGNLKGCRRLMEDYAERVGLVISFDLYQQHIYTSCIGSRRYEITVHTKGGHSYHDFGKPNAIAVLAGLVTELYGYQPSGQMGEQTTFNAGVIEGGTSVNTIAQEAGLLFEFRSNQAEGLKRGDEFLNHVLKKEMKGVEIGCKMIGERPCMGEADTQKIQTMAEICKRIVQEVTGTEPEYGAASTDCNIPLSMGIPALCLGLVTGGGAHTKEEWIEEASLQSGLEIAEKIVEAFAAGEISMEKADEAGTESRRAGAAFTYVMRDGLSDEEEQREVLEILQECDADFVPPLSARQSTCQKGWEGQETELSTGVLRYYEELSGQVTLLQKQEGHVTAFLSYKPSFTCEALQEFGNVCYLTTLCIRKKYRGMGLAPVLYEKVCGEIRKRKPDAIIALRTWSTNRAQLHLMEKLGFQCVARLSGDRGPGIDTVYFVKEDLSENGSKDQ